MIGSVYEHLVSVSRCLTQIENGGSPGHNSRKIAGVVLQVSGFCFFNAIKILNLICEISDKRINKIQFINWVNPLL